MGQVKIQNTRKKRQQQKTKMVQYKIDITYKEAEKVIGYILKRYYKYKKLWNKQFSERLLEYALQNYAINLKLGINLRFFPIYKLIEME